MTVRADDREQITRRGFLLFLGIAPFAADAIASALSVAPGGAVDPEDLPPIVVVPRLHHPSISPFRVAKARRLVHARYEAPTPRGTAWVEIEVPFDRRGRVSQATLHRAVDSARYHLGRKARFAGAPADMLAEIQQHRPNIVEQATEINREIYFDVLPASTPSRRTKQQLWMGAAYGDGPVPFCGPCDAHEDRKG